MTNTKRKLLNGYLQKILEPPKKGLYFSIRYQKTDVLKFSFRNYKQYSDISVK